MPMTLEEERRYARQIMLPDVGIDGQEKLRQARVLVIGAGGLGSPLLTYLAAAGIGTLGIIDDDRVERSNLARQIIHEEGDIGRLKVQSAEDRLAELNPACRVITYPFALTDANARDIVAQYDVIADGCDNFKARFATNAACVSLRKPLVSAAIAGWQGQVMTIVPETACYQCLVSPEAPEANTCRESGIIGPLAGQVGCMQALEVVRLLLGSPAYAGKLAIIDGKTGLQRVAIISADPHCPICAGR